MVCVECEFTLSLLRTALIVRALDTSSATRARGDAHSILGLGMSAPAGLGGFHPVLVRLRDSGITGMRVIGTFCAIAVLHGRHSTWSLLRRSHRALVPIDGNGTLHITAYGLTKRVRDAIGR